MLIFIDEAGDPGFQFKKGSSKYFILSAIVFDSDSHSIEANNLIDQLRKELKLPEDFEFHFAVNSNRIKEAMLTQIQKMTFAWVAICINKESLWADSMKNSDRLLTKVSEYLHSNLGNRLENAKIIYDNGKGKEFYKTLKTHLTRAFNKDGVKRIRDLKGEDSKRNNLLQLADYCCSSLNQYEKGTKYGQDLYYKNWAKTKIKYQHWPISD